MFERHKLPNLEAGLIIVLIVVSVFSFAFFTEDIAKEYEKSKYWIPEEGGKFKIIT